MESLSAPLVAEIPEFQQSKCSKCSKCYSFILDILTFPLTIWFTLSCWTSRKLQYFQYDASILLNNAFQTIIALLWSSVVKKFVTTTFISKREDHIAFYTIYVILTYILCNIFVIILQRRHLLNATMTFYIGVLAHILAFGIRDLAAIIMIWFIEPKLYLAVTYFFICLLISILIIYGLSIIRTCFFIAKKGLHKIHDSTSEIRHKFMHSLSSKIAQNNSLNSSEISNNTNSKSVETNNLITTAAVEHIEHKTHTHSFNDLLREIDADAIAVGMSYVFVQIIWLGCFGDYFPVPDDEKLDTGEDDPVFKIHLVIATTIVLGFIILCIFLIYRLFIPEIQTRRDEKALKMFKSLQSVNNDDNRCSDCCCIAYCLKYSYKFYKLSEFIVIFMVGILGWSYGWTFVVALYVWTDVKIRFIYAVCCSVTVIVIYRILSWHLRRKFEKLENQILTKLKMEANNEYNLMGTKYTTRLYKLTHTNHFLYKSFGLMIALPWELTVESLLEKIKEHAPELITRIVVAIIVSLYLVHCGLKFIEVAERVKMYSTEYMTNAYLKQNYLQLKQIKKSVVNHEVIQQASA
eukprot:460591_1